MKYYIFGGDGFVGRYLSNALIERGENVVVGDILSTLDERINKKVIPAIMQNLYKILGSKP